jgi:hypothetical protein
MPTLPCRFCRRPVTVAERRRAALILKDETPICGTCRPYSSSLKKIREAEAKLDAKLATEDPELLATMQKRIAEQESKWQAPSDN